MKTLSFFLQKVLLLLHFGFCQNCMRSANLLAENHQKLYNKTVLSAGEPCTCEYVTLLQSFHRGTLSIHWYIAQSFQPTFSMSVLFRRLFSTAIFSSFSKVAIVYIYIYIYIYISSSYLDQYLVSFWICVEISGLFKKNRLEKLLSPVERSAQLHASTKQNFA